MCVYMFYMYVFTPVAIKDKEVMNLRVQEHRDGCRRERG